MHAALTPRLVFLLVLPPLMWAGNAVVGRLMSAAVDPILLNALRWLGAGALLLPLGWRAFRSRTARAAIAQRWGYLTLLGLLGFGTYNALQYTALRTSTPVNVTLIASSLPVWTLLIGALVYRVRPTPRQLAGAALSCLGVLFVLARGSIAVLRDIHFAEGDVLMVIAIICWALYSWLLARPPAHMLGDQRPGWNWAEFLLVQMVFGIAWNGATLLVQSAVSPAPTLVLTPALLATIAFVAIGPSILAYRAWGVAVAEGGPGLAALFNNLTPLFAAVLSAALIGEAPQLYHGIAFALIAAGIAVSLGGGPGGPGRR
jgi:drug/metabolite transporter (DMT)-like permease